MRLEQPSTIPFLGDAGERGLALEGFYVPGSDENAGLLAAPPHPLYGGSALNPVVTELALRAQSLAMTSLRFNWRGVGASAGEPSGSPDDALADYAAALRFFEDCVPGAIVACGYSWGAIAALRAGASSPRVRRLVLVAPPASMLDADLLESFRGDVLIAVGENDELADPFALSQAAKRASAELVLLDDTDHFFGNGAAALGRAVEAWLR